MRAHRGRAWTVVCLLVATGCGQGSADSPSVEVRPEVLEPGVLTEVADQATFADALLRALIDRGEPDAPFTFFAPRNETLAAQLQTTDRDLTAIADDQVLANQLVDAHLVDGELSNADLRALEGKTITTVAGDEVTIVVEASTGRLFLEATDGTRARVIASDVDAGVGIVHFIDEPLSVP